MLDFGLFHERITLYGHAIVLMFFDIVWRLTTGNETERTRETADNIKVAFSAFSPRLYFNYLTCNIKRLQS